MGIMTVAVKSALLENSPAQCVFCLAVDSNLDMVMLGACGHIFHTDCFKRFWVRKVDENVSQHRKCQIRVAGTLSARDLEGDPCKKCWRVPCPICRTETYAPQRNEHYMEQMDRPVALHPYLVRTLQALSHDANQHRSALAALTDVQMTLEAERAASLITKSALEAARADTLITKSMLRGLGVRSMLKFVRSLPRTNQRLVSIVAKQKHPGPEPRTWTRASHIASWSRLPPQPRTLKLFSKAFCQLYLQSCTPGLHDLPANMYFCNRGTCRASSYTPLYFSYGLLTQAALRFA